MKTLVTGATGHVGTNLVRELLRRGEEVRALIQPGTNLAAIEGLDVERVVGDLLDLGEMERVTAGCDRIYHVAAFVSIRRGQQQSLYDSNVIGTRNLLTAAERSGVKRTVVCSSFGAVGFNQHGPSDETMTINPFDVHLDYELAKAIAEIEVLRAAVRGLDVVIVNPTGIVGPYDFGPSSMGQTILDFANRRLRVYIAGMFNFVALRDVVQGHLLAMEKGRRGERYILGGEHLSLDEILDFLHEFTGAPKPRVRLPARMMIPVAHVSDAFMRRFFPHVAPRFTPGSVRLLTSGKRADFSKAQRELGFSPTSVKEAFRESCAWFKERGQIP